MGLSRERDNKRVVSNFVHKKHALDATIGLIIVKHNFDRK